MPSAGIFGSAHVAAGGITATFQTSAGSTSNATSFTFTAQPIGTASATRRVVVAVAGRDTAANPTSVTVGGVSLSLDASRVSTHVLTIWSGVVTSGTTGDVVVSYAASNTFCGIGVWTLSAGSPTGNTATGTTSSGAITLNVTTTSGDVVIGAVAYAVLSSVPSGSVTWTAASEQYDAEVDGRFRNHSGADLVASGSSANMSLTVANPDSATASSGAAAAVAYA